METIFMNTKNSKTNQPHILLYNFTDKLNLKNPNKNTALANLSIYYTWKNITSAYNNNKFKISASTWDETFDIPDGSYSVAVFKIISSILLKNMKLLPILLRY